MRKVVARCVVIWCAALVSTAALAQTTSTIAGVARDASGAVLPGVTVEAASPALIEKVRTVVTDEQGQYKIIDLRPGTYTVTFTLTGFATVKREGIELATGFTAQINGDMRIGTLEETVTVSGQSPLVDTQGVEKRDVVTKEVIDAMPTGKSWNAIGQLAVGVTGQQVDVGGSSGEQQNLLAVHGSSFTDNIRTLDGMYIANYACNYSCTGLSANDASTEELSYEVGAQSADVAGGGILVNIIPKDGGNLFSGSAFGSLAEHSWQSDNLTSNLRALGITSVDGLDRLNDTSVGLGGPVMRDKLWFFTSHKYWGTRLLRSNDYWAKDPFAVVYTPDLSRQAIDDQWNLSSDLRLTWQMSPRNKISAYYNYAPRETPHWTTTSLRPPEAANLQRINLNHFETVVFRSTISNRLLFEAGAGNMTEDWTREPVPDAPSSLTYPITDLATGVNYRAYSATFSHNVTEVHSFRSSLSYVTGSHAFKLGFNLQNGPGKVNSWAGPLDNASGQLGNTALVFNGGVPVSVTVRTTPYTELDDLVADLGIYAQDRWTLKRFTFNLALRFDYLNNKIPSENAVASTWINARTFPEIDNVPNWKDIGPRVGVAYDLFGTGRTALKASVSRYVTTSTVGFSRLANPILTTVNSATRSWNDANHDFIPQLSELGPLNPSTFGTTTVATVYDPSLVQGWGVRPGNWEVSAGVQHQLMRGVAVDVSYFRRSYFNLYATQNQALSPTDFSPYCVTAPTDPRLPSGGGYQICGLYDVDPSKFGATQNHVYNYSKFGNGSESFNGVDLQATARFGRALLTGGFSTGRLAYSYCASNFVGTVSTLGLPYGGGLVDSFYGVAGGLLSLPNTLYCSVTYPFQTQSKLLASYSLPFDIQVSGTLQSYPGPQITASWAAPLSAIQPSLGRPLAGGVRTATVPLIAPGTEFGTRRNQLDLRLAKGFRLGSNRRLQVLADIYNIFNTDAYTSVNTTYGSQWLQPTSILQARFVKLGAQLKF